MALKGKWKFGYGPPKSKYNLSAFRISTNHMMQFARSSFAVPTDKAQQ